MSTKVVSISSVWVVGLLVLALVASHANAIECQEAIKLLFPCKDYLFGQSSSLTPQCCEGANSLNNIVHTKPEITSICKCLKKAAADLHVKVDRAKSIPDKCHIKVPLPIDPNVDCDRV